MPGISKNWDLGESDKKTSQPFLTGMAHDYDLISLGKQNDWQYTRTWSGLHEQSVLLRLSEAGPTLKACLRTFQFNVRPFR